MSNFKLSNFWKWTVVLGIGLILASIDDRFYRLRCGLGYLEDPNPKYEPDFLKIMSYTLEFVVCALLGALMLKFFGKPLYRKLIKNNPPTALDSEITPRIEQKPPFTDCFFEAGMWLAAYRLVV